MKPNTLRISMSVIISMLVVCTATAQQSTTRRAPQLTTEDVKEPGSPAINMYPATKTITRDSAKWERYAPNELALSIELPGKPLLMGLSMADTADQEIRMSKAYVYENQDISAFVLRSLSKRSRVSSSDLRNFGAGFLDASARKPGVSGVENQTKLRDDSTVLLESNYLEGSIQFQTRGFVHSQGNNVWLIVTKFAKADESARALSLRILNSVKFN